MHTLDRLARLALIAAPLSVSLSLFAAAPPDTPVVDLPSRENVTRLIVTGDAGATHSRLRAGILAVQKATGIDAIILTGDNFYPCGISSVSDPQWSKISEHFGPAHVPIYTVLGNHDYGDARHDRKKSALCAGFASDPQAEISASGKIPFWFAPARNFLLRNELADLLMIDTQPVAMDWSEPFLGSSTSAETRAWLAAELARSKAPWRIVIGHHTIFSSGVHGRSNAFDQQHMRRLLPLLRAAQVDLYLCGHDHDMELLGDLRGARPLFLVDGAGSGLDQMKPRKPSALASEPPTLWPSPLVAMYGFVVLELRPSELAITFHDSSGVPVSRRFVVKK